MNTLYFKDFMSLFNGNLDEKISMIWMTAPSPEKTTTFKSSCNKETEKPTACMT